MDVDGSRVVRFEELIAEGLLEIGDGYRAKNSELGGDGPIFLRAGHVRDTHVNVDGVERFHSHLAAKVASKAARVGDVVITTKGNSTGRVAFVTGSLPPFVYSPHLSYWRSRDPARLDAGFLRYWSRSAEFTEQLAGLASSTDMAPYLSLVDQRRLRITLPPVKEQRAIASILGALDDKIELNRRMNETLESIARALFKSWFVDFDPVRAKAEGRQPVGMDAETARLFPASLVVSACGVIPAGWSSGSILANARLLSGGTPKTDRADYWGGDIAWASAKDISQAREAFLVATERSITQQGLDESATQLIPAHSTVVVARGATTGRMAMLGSEMAMNQTCYALASTVGTPFTLYCQLRAAIDAIVQSAHGSVFDTITTSTFATSQVVQPEPRIASAFERLSAPLFRRLLSSSVESRTLASLRESLLPQLLSGELRVRDAEHTVEAAT